MIKDLFTWWNNIILLDKKIPDVTPKIIIKKSVLDNLQLSKNGSYSNFRYFIKK